MPSTLTAAAFIQRLEAVKSAEEKEKLQRYFKTGPGGYGEGDAFIGVKMGQVFLMAKEFMAMPLDEVDKMLESPIHEHRTGAMSIMDYQARSKKTPGARRKELFDLYLRRHDRINNWDLVDRAAIYVIGGYLFDKPRKPLYDLALSENLWERRTAIVSTAYFIRNRDLADTFKIAESLMADKEDLIHKATGWMLRFAGDKNRNALFDFLDRYAAVMPRTMLRYSLEKVGLGDRERYMRMKR